jgi:hypothetical protein
MEMTRVFDPGRSGSGDGVPGDVASEVTVAVSAMTVNVNKQQDGYSYLSIH